LGRTALRVWEQSLAVPECGVSLTVRGLLRPGALWKDWSPPNQVHRGQQTDWVLI